MNSGFFSRSVTVLLVSVLSSCQTPSIDSLSDFFPKGDKSRAAQPGQISGVTPGDAEQPLDLNRRTFVILQVDGGGIMGITPAVVLRHLEEGIQSGRPNCQESEIKDFLSVVSGTSTGAIIAGSVAAGIPAARIEKYYTDTGVKLFQSTGRYPLGVFPFFRPKFKREAFQHELYKMLVDDSDCHCATQTLRDLSDGPLLSIAAYGLCSKRTHFFRTRGTDGGPIPSVMPDIQLADAISASALSAALYFGKLTAKPVVWDHVAEDGSVSLIQGAVYQDGGQGTQNCTMALVALEALARDWCNRLSPKDQVVLISLGCGNDYTPVSYNKASRASGTAQVLSFLRNQARQESALLQWRGLRTLAAANPNFKLFRFDYHAPQGSSAFSARLADKYRQAGEEIAHRKEFTRLISDLCKVRSFGKYDDRPATQPERRQYSTKPMLKAL